MDKSKLLPFGGKAGILDKAAGQTTGPVGTDGLFRLAAEKADCRQVNEVKVLLIGEGGVGKTSLAGRILGQEFSQIQPPTDGICITSCQSGSVKVNIWDFGGQEILHATHQFFMSKRSLYVLVLDGQRNERPEYWLRHVDSLGGDSPVLIVLNKQDANPGFDLNRPNLRRKHPMIRSFHPVSCATGQGIPEFKEELLRAIDQVQMAEVQWPSNWFRIKQRLEVLKEQEPCISWDQYEKICAKEDLTEAAVQQDLMDCLHDLGVAVCFRGDPALKNVQVLDPSWITSAVYKIVKALETKRCGGVLLLDSLEQILKQSSKKEHFYPKGTHGYIVGLLKQFELCFSLDEGRLLFPQLLPMSEPEFPFDYAGALNLVLRYDDFLPLSVMPRFMVESCQDIKDQLRWRTGVVLENKASQSVAVVRADNEERSISIHVNGPWRHAYLAVIVLFFRNVNGKLKVSELIPIPDDPKCMADCTTLLNHVKKNLDAYIPAGSDKVHDAKKLLESIQCTDERGGWEKVVDIMQTMAQDERSRLALLKKLGELLSLNIGPIGLNLKPVIERLGKKWLARRLGK